MSYGSLPALKMTIDGNNQKSWIVLQHVIHSHLQLAIDWANEVGFDLEEQYVGRFIHCEIEGGVQDGTTWEDEPTVTLFFRRRDGKEPGYTLYRCVHVVSKGPKKGVRCYRPTIPSHGKNHWVEEKMMSCPEEDHCRWPGGVCMVCGKVVT